MVPVVAVLDLPQRGADRPPTTTTVADTTIARLTTEVSAVAAEAATPLHPPPVLCPSLTAVVIIIILVVIIVITVWGLGRGRGALLFPTPGLAPRLPPLCVPCGSMQPRTWADGRRRGRTWLLLILIGQQQGRVVVGERSRGATIAIPVRHNKTSINNSSTSSRANGRSGTTTVTHSSEPTTEGLRTMQGRRRLSSNSTDSRSSSSSSSRSSCSRCPLVPMIDRNLTLRAITPNPCHSNSTNSSSTNTTTKGSSTNITQTTTSMTTRSSAIEAMNTSLIVLNQNYR